MPSKSDKQRKFMAAAANNPKFAKKVGIKQSVAKEFHNADRRKKMQSGGLAQAMRPRLSQGMPIGGRGMRSMPPTIPWMNRPPPQGGLASANKPMPPNMPQGGPNPMLMQQMQQQQGGMADRLHERLQTPHMGGMPGQGPMQQMPPGMDAGMGGGGIPAMMAKMQGQAGGGAGGPDLSGIMAAFQRAQAGQGGGPGGGMPGRGMPPGMPPGGGMPGRGMPPVGMRDPRQRIPGPVQPPQQPWMGGGGQGGYPGNRGPLSQLGGPGGSPGGPRGPQRGPGGRSPFRGGVPAPGGQNGLLRASQAGSQYAGQGLNRLMGGMRFAGGGRVSKKSNA